MENNTEVVEVVSLEISELGVTSEIHLVRLACLGSARINPWAFSLTHGCSRGYDCNAAISDDASTSIPVEYV
jgi:hypothetical protein